MFTGTGTALVTPFRTDGSLDEAALRRLVRRQIDAGVDFLVPCGTTGESPTLTHEEHLRVVQITIELAKGKVPVLAGAGASPAGGFARREATSVSGASERAVRGCGAGKLGDLRGDRRPPRCRVLPATAER